MPDPVLSFWGKVAKAADSDCWNWTAAISNTGYGAFWDGKTLHTAPRYSYRLHFGSIPEGLHVLHRCDNRACVNPLHLFVGTNNDNIRDRIGKGRPGPKHNLRGEKHPKSKLSDKAVVDIRRRRQRGETFTSIAARYHVAHSTIQAIVARKAWPHVA